MYRPMEQQIAEGAKITSYVGGGTATVFGGMTANDLAAIGGLVFIALTWLTTLIYKHKHYKLEKMRLENEIERRKTPREK